MPALKPTGSPKDCAIGLKVTAATNRAIRAEAARRGIPINGLLVPVIEAALREWGVLDSD